MLEVAHKNIQWVSFTQNNHLTRMLTIQWSVHWEMGLVYPEVAHNCAFSFETLVLQCFIEVMLYNLVRTSHDTRNVFQVFAQHRIS